MAKLQDAPLAKRARANWYESDESSMCELRRSSSRIRQREMSSALVDNPPVAGARNFDRQILPISGSLTQFGLIHDGLFRVQSTGLVFAVLLRHDVITSQTNHDMPEKKNTSRTSKITFPCSACGTRWNAPVSKVGERIICEKCGGAMVVPRPDGQQRAKKKRVARTPDQRAETTANPGEYRVGQGIEPPPLPATSYFDIKPPVTAEPPDPPPRWTFFSGVFQFPWYPGLWPRWIYMSIGMVLMNFQSLAVVLCLSMGGIGTLAAFLLFVSLVPLAILVLSCLAACSVRIVEQTAAGQDVMREWPEPDWREWVWVFVHVAYVTLMVVGVAYGIMSVPGFPNIWARIALGGSFVLLVLPVLLLSSLESESMIIPFSAAVFHSLYRQARAWFLFYLVSALLCGVCLVPLIVLTEALPILAAVLGGPVLTAFLLIEARLLGRVGWVITMAETK